MPRAAAPRASQSGGVIQYSKPLAACQPGFWRELAARSRDWVHALLPPCCYLCLDPGQPPALDLCRDCEQDLPRNREQPLLLDAAFAPYRYEFPLVELVHRLKYGNQPALARILGTLLGRRLAERGRPRVDALVPVPLHAAREARRGYNQAREIAVFAARELALPVRIDLVRRVRDTPEQAALPAIARRANVSEAFEARGVPPLSVAIVDDVLTTGATVEALAKALRRAGCRRIEVWAVARAGGP